MTMLILGYKVDCPFHFGLRNLLVAVAKQAIRFERKNKALLLKAANQA
jgi:hypothetical protein